METKNKTKEMLEFKKIIIEMKNAFCGLMSILGTTDKRIHTVKINP